MTTLTADAFYQELIARNRGLIPEVAQDLLRHSRFVVAGCGSTGGAAIEPLVRAGVTRLVLADPDVYELSNLNRQDATVADLGRNKAEVAAGRVRSINPHADVTVLPDGYRAGTGLLAPGDVVIDAVDVTTPAGIAAKLALHEEAHRAQVPVITAYDIAGMQLVEVFDYRRGIGVLRGRVGSSATPSEVLAALIPGRVLPGEILPVLSRGALEGDTAMPQLAATARLFGAVVVPLVLRVLRNQRVPRRVRIDLFAAVRPRPLRFGHRMLALARLPLVVWRERRRRR
jgi:molybdopterin/thiamine biosynthesis adenylyltransferase